MVFCRCERGFSCLKRVKTHLRNRLSQEVVNALMMSAIEGPAVDHYPYQAEARQWNSMRNRTIDTGSSK